MALIDKYTTGTDATFVRRVTVAVLQAAANVQAEPTNTANHQRRSKLAEGVFFSSERYGKVFALAVAAAPGITGPEASDSDLLFTANSLWDAVAGQSFDA